MITLAEAVGGKHRIIGGPFGSNLTQADYTPNGVPIIRGSNMSAPNRWVQGPFVFVSADKFNRDLRNNAAKPGNIIVTQRGTLGQVSILSDDSPFEQYVISQSQMSICVDEKLADRNFVYYFLTSPNLLEYIKVNAIQTGVPHINLGLLREVEVEWPAVHEQREIAATLGALDDKIELNRRMNETLEAMARAIFKDWFVDFGPTRAKMDGHAPYLAPDLWALFPDRLDTDGKPEGWLKSTIGEEVEVVGGSTPSTADQSYWNGEFFWATPKDLSALNSPVLFRTERKITDAGLSQISSGLLPEGAVLLSSRAPIGYLAIAQVPTAINQGFIGMKCNGQLSDIFVWMWTYANMSNILEKANGSTFQEISKTNFRPIPVTVASPNLLRSFEQLARPLWSRLVKNTQEIESLTKTRDLLLPKLMSGEIQLRDTKKMIGEST